MARQGVFLLDIRQRVYHTLTPSMWYMCTATRKCECCPIYHLISKCRGENDLGLYLKPGLRFWMTDLMSIPDTEGHMEDLKTKAIGNKLLVRKYRKKFQIRENLKYYSPKDYRRAEKKYIRFCLATGKC